MSALHSSIGILEKQIVLPWSKAIVIALESLRVRFSRSLITSISIMLATAFLSFIICNHRFLNSLIALDQADVNFLLQKRGIDLEGGYPGFQARELWIIASSFLVCLVGVSNALLMSVTERIKEIGTMKCLGALDSFVVRLFLLEALFMGTVSSIAGSLIGMIFCVLLNFASFGMAAADAIAAMELLSGTVFASVVGTGLSVLAAIYPSLIAARMQPVEAMRAEF